MEKPLPNVPPNLTTLTLAARAHLHRFILQTLEEDLVDEREEWAEILQDALHQLGADISRGGWLTGIKRARNARRKQRLSTLVEERLKRESTGEHTGTDTVKDGKSKDKQKEVEKMTPGSVRLVEPLVEHDLKPFPKVPDVGREAALPRLRDLVSKPFQPMPKPSAKHLLLTVDHFGSTDATQETEFYVVRSGIDCTFLRGVFTLPTDAGGQTPGRVLYGLDEWEEVDGEDPVQIVGGTFRFRGVPSPTQHESLCKVLRLSVFMYFSLVLEQHVLSNSGVKLNFPKLSIPKIRTTPLPEGQEMPVEVRRKGKHEPSLASGLWTFFSKKTGHLLTRAAHVGPSFVRRVSLELPLTHSLHGTSSLSPSIEESTAPRPRRFSFMSGAAPTEQAKSPAPEPQPFTAALKSLQRCGSLLWTSPGLMITLPSVLVSLAEKERADPPRKLTGDERAALTSILGWEGKDAMAKGMTGTPGFVRQQGISVLYSKHIPLLLPTALAPSAPGPSTASSLQTPVRAGYCGTRRKWVTYRFYDYGSGADESLGDAIVRMCADADEACDNPGCHFKRGDHDLRWIHGGVRVIAAVGHSTGSEDKPVSTDEIRMWAACAVCGKESRTEQMLDGTYLFSFAKYLELLIYSPAICELKSPLCEHTTVISRTSATHDTPPETWMNILRKFSVGSRTVTFSLTALEDIFELRVPRLQLVRHRLIDTAHEGGEVSPVHKPVSQDVSNEEERRTLRREIMNWWQGLSEHIDRLEENFIRDDDRVHHKALPRLPSGDDAYEFEDDSALATPKGHPQNLPSDVSAIKHSNGSHATSPSDHGSSPLDLPSDTAGSASNSVLSLSTISSHSHETDSIYLLSGLRHSFQKTEQGLYLELSKIPTTALNDVRRSFLTAARGASRRLSAWERKHSSHLPKGSNLLGSPAVSEPEWWKCGCHAVPGGNIIVRENDWGSIIAFTLSSQDYRQELANLSSPVRCDVPVPPSTPASARPSLFGTGGASFKRLLNGPLPQLDPDQDDVVWQEPEAYSAVITRKEHPRDPTSLMSIRDVLRHNKGGPDDQSTPAASRFIAAFSGAKPAPLGAPSSAWAKPEVEISTQTAEGNVNGMPEAVEAAGKILHDLEANAGLPASWHSSVSAFSTSPVTTSSFLETNIRRGKSSSIISTDSQGTIGAGSSRSRSTTPPPVPPKVNHSSVHGISGASHPSTEHITTAQSSLAASFTNTLTNAMRYVLKSSEAQQPSPHSQYHALFVGDSPAIDDRPHIKYDWTIGKRLKFSCTVYYAKQFDELRKRCGIEDAFLKSLARSENWAAQGGKSKSNFWKTTDDQFIIKTLVNAWNVADLQVLIELGPSYFRYMDATASKPTILAKLLGFYTVEIRNLDSGTTQAKADLLVMENLFCSQKIVKTFDLKGIQGRKVKAAASTRSKTLFDGEWIEGQRRALTLLRPHSKVVFHEAIKADCDFLARSNIMDYSLLVGINEERKEIVCGLVDTIGSYTFAKTLEYKAKQGLSAGKEVTVIPPHEYEERFVSAMDDYFLACPDKWSRPLDDTKVPNDYQQLPSVL